MRAAFNNTWKGIFVMGTMGRCQNVNMNIILVQYEYDYDDIGFFCKRYRALFWFWSIHLFRWMLVIGYLVVQSSLISCNQHLGSIFELNPVCGWVSLIPSYLYINILSHKEKSLFFAFFCIEMKRVGMGCFFLLLLVFFFFFLLQKVRWS